MAGRWTWRLAGPLAALAGLAILGCEVNIPRAAADLRGADARWLVAGEVLTLLSVGCGAFAWGLLARAGGARMSWAEVATWSGRAALAGQLVPGGAGGDAVRLVAARRSGPRGTALGSVVVARLCGSVGIAAWGVAAAVLLRDAVGDGVVTVSIGLAGVVAITLALALTLDGSVAVLERLLPWRRLRAVTARIRPIGAVVASYRHHPALVGETVLLGMVSWGFNLAALVCLARAVGVIVGWQVFAVAIPVTLVATLVPLSANGIGVREGILIGLLARAGVGAAPAAALSVLVDLQLVPIALLGALLSLTPAARRRLAPAAQAAPSAPATARAPAASPVRAGRLAALAGAVPAPLSAAAAQRAPRPVGLATHVVAVPVTPGQPR